MLANVTHILPLATIQHRRVLPIEGKVLVRAGQNVSATDVIAEADLNPEHLALDLARALGVSPSQAEQHLQRRVGDLVSKGSVIASRRGLTSRVLRAPVDGRVVAISEGRVMLAVQREPYRLLAGHPGNVASIIPDHGALIQTTGAWVQGVWGNGHVESGLLTVMSQTPDRAFTPGELDVSRRGSMMLAGYCDSRETLEVAANVPIRGLILASLSPGLIPIAAKMPYPIVVVEGFGRIPMNEAAWSLLTTNEGREVTLNAEPFDGFTGARPEILIPLQGAGQPAIPSDVSNLSVGIKVRVLRAPFTGAVGTIDRLPENPALFPSGLRLPAAEVAFTSGEKTLVPVANIEVLG